MERDRWPKDKVIAALRETHGMIAPAARKLGYTRAGLYKYIQRHQLEEVIKEERESTLDFAELFLWKAITEGNLTAIIFYLKCQGKSRGYVERPLVVTSAPSAAAPSTSDDGETIYIDVRANGTNGHHA